MHGSAQFRKRKRICEMTDDELDAALERATTRSRLDDLIAEIRQREQLTEAAVETLADEVDSLARAIRREFGWDEQAARNGALDHVVDDRSVHCDIRDDVRRMTVYYAVERRLGFRGTQFEPAV